MNAESAILSIDIGSTALKAALLSPLCRVIAYTRIEYGSGRLSDEWILALAKATKELLSCAKTCGIEAVSISGNGPTIVSENGETLMWNEPSPFLESKTTSLFIPRLIFFKKKYPLAWETSSRIFSCPEYAIFWLTSEAITILPESRFQSAYWTENDLFENGFSKEDAKKLPPFVRAGSFAGKITAKAAKITGLLEGTLVFAAAVDFVSALVGTGTVFPGTLCDRAGSSEGINLCTKKPFFAKGIRTTPSVIPGLWNESVLIPESGKLKKENEDELLFSFAKAIEKLKSEAVKAGEMFPSQMSASGGQCADEKWTQKKAEAAKMTIQIPWTHDAELLGNMIFAHVSLGDYDDIQEAAAVLCKTDKIFVPQTKR